MDYQRSIVERLGDPAVLDAARRAVAAARSHHVPVMYVRVAFRDGYPEVASSNRSFGALRDAGADMVQDSPGTQIDPALQPQPHEPVILKRRVSAFTGSDLEVLLRGADADTLVLAGIATSGVVLSTLRQAADLDYRLTVLSDACADSDPEVHRVLTEKVFPRQAVVTTTDQWAKSL